MRPATLFSLPILLSGGMLMTAFTQELDRTIIPKGQAVPRIVLPEIQKAKLPNGLTVWLVEDHELPTVSLNLVFRSGTDHDPVDKPGLVMLTAEVWDEGTKTRTALQIADELDFIGANLAINAFTDGITATLSTLTKHLDNALEVYADVIVNPTFPEKEFSRLQQQRLTSLLQQKDRPSTVASLTFARVLYGDKHPYGLNELGSEQSIKSMTREDLVRFYETYLRPNNATLIVVGDVTLQQMLSRLEVLFSGWKPGRIPTLTLNPPPPIKERQVYLVDKPDAAQSEVRIGYAAVARNSPEFFPISVMNLILGGQFSSRLNMNLRERRGFTYGARSMFAFYKTPGPFVASAAVTTAKTDSAVQEFFNEIDKMRAEGPTEEELDFAKKSMTGTFARSFETPSQIANALQNVVLYTLPEDYYNFYLQNINNVSLADARRVAAKYLDSSRMAVVVVGDAKVVKEGLEKLRIGKVVLTDVDGNTVAQ